MMPICKKDIFLEWKKNGKKFTALMKKHFLKQVTSSDAIKRRIRRIDCHPNFFIFL